MVLRRHTPPMVNLTATGGVGMRESVVITGMGAVTPLGTGVDTFWANLLAGDTGLRAITAFDLSDRRVQIGAPPAGFDPETRLSPRDNQRLSLSTQMAVVAAEEALGQARLLDDDERRGAGVILGASMTSVAAAEPYHKKYYETGRVSAVGIPKCMNNAAAAAVSIRFGLHGQLFTLDAACASSTHAIGLAFLLIQSGIQSIVVTGGADTTLNPVLLEGWSALRVLSECNDEPARACKPFSRNRDGFVLGEGAGILVLESESSARARGVPILARVLGYGFSSDAHHLTAPSEEGQVQAMERALVSAGLAPEDIDHINAHGTGTPLNDRVETSAVKKVFGSRAPSIPVVSIKGAVGHLLGAAGAVEAIASTLTTMHDRIPPTRNYEEQDPECDLDYVPGVARSMPVRTVLSNSFAFGGSNACLVVGKAS
jgi:3-oxoacyl-[acyl-carrier-protein] synthase II